jgi:uncharacterized linocin/CFP29 family protein
MDHLFRELAPVSDVGWQEIEKEAARTLKTTLAARKLVDFKGPLGWRTSAVGMGRSKAAEPPSRTTVGTRLREVLPLVELRVPFQLRRAELDALDRGAKDFDNDPIIAAAREIAICEQAASSVEISGGAIGYPSLVTDALNRLRDAGVGGPFAIALSERCYAGLTESTEEGYPVLQHVRRHIDGPVVWAPGLDGAVVLSMRGEDFELTVGEDFSIGYLSHDANYVHLYIEESFTFWLLSPQAAVPMVFPQQAAVPH